MSWMMWVSMVAAVEPERGPPAEAVADAAEEAPAGETPVAEAEPEAEAPAEAPADEEPVVRSRFKLPVQLHGFAETIARGDLTAKTFDFSLQQAELDVLGDWNDVVFFRTDLQYDAYYFDASTPVGFLGSFVEQATVDVQVHKGSALKIGLGRFNAPMGFEALDPVDRPIASYSQVFNWLDPFLLTGARVSGAYKAFDFVVWVSQGYEVIADNNTDKTVGGRVAVRPGSAAYLGLAASYGSEYADNANRRLNLSLDYTITPTSKLLIGGEVTFRNEQGASKVRADADGRALGAILEGSYRFHPMFSLAARVDTIQDFDGIIWGSKMGTTTWTVAPTLHLFDHARIQLEYKGYHATQPLFTTVSATPSAPNTSPTASQQFQGMNLAVDPTTAAGISHALTLQAIANF